MKRASNNHKILTVVGARPQFIKAAAVSPALKSEGLREILLHTGQHYDWEMSEAFFEGLKLSSPDYNLETGSGSHGMQTGRMLEAIEQVLKKEKPDLVLVYGDTNSTLAGALAAAKLNIPVAHVEAGLRSFDRRMPEEINRVLADHVSSLLFAPTGNAVGNLKREGIEEGVDQSGDVMFDLCRKYGGVVKRKTPRVLKSLGLTTKQFVFATVHRAENTDSREKWHAVLKAFSMIAAKGFPVVWPVHPRTRELLGSKRIEGVQLIRPLPYVETQVLAANARVVLTDSGGLQKEAAFLGTYCVILRDRTEWIELVDEGVAVLAGTVSEKILEGVLQSRGYSKTRLEKTFGEGKSSERIAKTIRAYMRGKTIGKT